MHHTHLTDAFVVGSYPSGEGSRMVVLFTRELGLIRAVAKSMREMRSKLRFHLQPTTLSSVALVRGRDVWRVTGAREVENFSHVFAKDREKLALMYRLGALLSRLLGDEEKQEKLFETLVQGLAFLKNETLTIEELYTFEYAFVIRVLAELGYVGEHQKFSDLLESPFSPELLSRIAPLRRDAIAVINRALEASQL